MSYPHLYFSESCDGFSRRFFAFALVTKCLDIQSVGDKRQRQGPWECERHRSRRNRRRCKSGDEVVESPTHESMPVRWKVLKLVENLSAERTELAVEVGGVGDRGIEVDTWVGRKRKGGVSKL